MIRILAALDDTPAADEVLRAAVDIAKVSDAAVTLLRVIEGSGELAAMNEALVPDARARLRELAKAVPPSRIESMRATTGIPWWQICEASGSGFDLLAIGATQFDPLQRSFGGTAAKIVNHCRCSVMVVRGWRWPLEQVLVAVDDSERARFTLESATALAQRARGRIRLLRVVDPSVVDVQSTTWDSARDAAHRALGSLEALVPKDLRDGVEVRYGRHPWVQICGGATEYGASVVVMGASRHTLTEIVLGTTAARVVEHTDRSVLLVKPRAAPSPEGASRA
jgi:universal stress protein F